MAFHRSSLISCISIKEVPLLYGNYVFTDSSRSLEIFPFGFVNGTFAKEDSTPDIEHFMHYC